MITHKICNSSFDGKPVSILRTDTKTGQQWAIPMNTDNTDYQTYLAWLAEGNTPLPAEETQ